MFFGGWFNCQYKSNFILILILFSSIEMNGQAALGLGSIVNRLLFVFPCSSFKALPADSLKLFMNSMTDLTCLFLQAVAKEEEVGTQLYLHVSAVFITKQKSLGWSKTSKRKRTFEFVESIGRKYQLNIHHLSSSSS